VPYSLGPLRFAASITCLVAGNVLFFSQYWKLCSMCSNLLSVTYALVPVPCFFSHKCTTLRIKLLSFDDESTNYG